MAGKEKKEVYIILLLIAGALIFYAGYSFSENSKTPISEHFPLKKIDVCKTLNDTNGISLPDLVITDLRISQPEVGSVKAEVAIKNIGTKIAVQPNGAPGLTVVLEDYPEVGGVNAIIPVLLPCEERTITLSWGMELGEHRVRAYADQFGGTEELDKTNNDFISPSFEVAVPKGKHLACVYNACKLIEGDGKNECNYLNAGC